MRTATSVPNLAVHQISHYTV